MIKPLDPDDLEVSIDDLPFNDDYNSDNGGTSYESLRD